MPLTTTHFHSNAPHALSAALAQLVPFSNDLMDADGFDTLPPSASLDSGGISPALSSIQSPHVSFSGVTFIREVSSIFERQMHLGIPQHPPGSVPNPYQQRSTRTFHFEIGPISPGLPGSQSLGTPSTFSSGGFPMSPTADSLFPTVPNSMSGPMINSPQTPHLLGNNPMSPGMIPINSTASWGTRRSPSPQPPYLPALSSMPTSSNVSNSINAGPMSTSFSFGTSTTSGQTPPPIGRTVHIPAPTGQAAYGPPPAAIGGQFGGSIESGADDKNNAQNFSSNQYRPSPVAMRSLSPNSRPLSAGVVRVRSWGGRGEIGGDQQQLLTTGVAASVPATRSEGLYSNSELMGPGAQTVEAPRRASWSAGMMRPGDAMALAQNGLFDSGVPSDPMSADGNQGRGAWDLHYNTAGDVTKSRAAQFVQSAAGQQHQAAQPQAGGPQQQPNHSIGPAITTRVRTYYRYVDKNGNPLSEPMPEKPRSDQTAAVVAAVIAGAQNRRAESTNGPSLLGESNSSGQLSVGGGGVAAAVGRSRSPAPFGRNAGMGPAQLLSPPSFDDLSNRSRSPVMGRIVNQSSVEVGGNQQRALSPRPQLGGRSVAEAVPRPQPKAAVVRRVTTTTTTN